MEIVTLLLLLGCCVLLLIKQSKSTAPFVPTKGKDVATLLTLVPHTPGTTFVDLGGGIGTTVVAVGRAFPDTQCYGFEISPVFFAISWLRSMRLKNVHIRWGSFWHYDWSAFDVLYLFWLPRTITRFESQMKQKIRSGQTVITYAFPIPWLRDSLVEEVKREGRLSLFVYRVQ